VIGYALNKQEFMDAICMRYRWKVKSVPTRCTCEETNCGSKPYMQTGRLYFNEAQLRSSDNESIEMFR